ncbi:uncharacterized protein LOC143862947 [Tasmannia lanceolata]|uniref:uncharacterized protein LOC143862947 n=1 Tax=Tasmannia lanceolata TaxID=3420 RepID=UPI004063D840
MEVDEMVVDELIVGRIGLEELKVGGIFPDLKVFKNKVREYAIARHFVFVPVDSKSTKYAVRCKNGSCPFRISGTNYLDCVRVNRFVPEHTCPSTMSGNDHPLATASWAAETCLGLFPRPGDVTPSLIRAYVKDKWSITLSYTKAFNAKVIIHEIMCGNAEASYRILPAYAQEMERCNPGTIMLVYRTRQLWGSGDDTFGRLFWSFGPNIRSFSRTVRPLILIDVTHLRGKYKGILLAATTLDGVGGLFPLAFAVVENENFDSWLWSPEEPSEVLSGSPTINSDSRINASRIGLQSEHHSGVRKRLRTSESEFRRFIRTPDGLPVGLGSYWASFGSPNEASDFRIGILKIHSDSQ